jgi:hypothetical protein
MTPDKPKTIHDKGSLKPLTSATLEAERKLTIPKVLSLVEIIEGAKLQLGSIISYPIDSVTGVKKIEDGWELLITLIELTRIPSSSDVLAEYSVSLDSIGEVVGYRQIQRFLRNQVGLDDGE